MQRVRKIASKRANLNYQLTPVLFMDRNLKDFYPLSTGQDKTSF